MTDRISAIVPNSSHKHPAVVLENVSKWFGTVQVLRSISLSVSFGERVVICGPSGSGKSTLIRCINQLEQHQEGNVIVDGVPLNAKTRNLAAIRREIGMVFQHFNLFPHLTVLENCMLAPMRTRNLSKKEAEETARFYLGKVRILDQIDKHPGQLSGGQQQRVAIARALCMRPKLMLFDEPTSALDPETVKEILDIMIDLASEGMTMICVTHEMGFARNVADRIIFMAEGLIIEEAKPQAFFDTPQNERTREFLNQILQH